MGEQEKIQKQYRMEQENKEEEGDDETEFLDAVDELDTNVSRTLDPLNVQSIVEHQPLCAEPLELQRNVRQQDGEKGGNN